MADVETVLSKSSLGANGSDTISDSVELSGMTFEYQANKLGSDNY